MPIKESDISIVIPTYLYADRIRRCVDSALESGAGEVIVVDNCSRDGTIECLSDISDTRFSLHENDRNVGLWENHFKALSCASKPWIKFIQADDYLLAGGLAKMAAVADENVSVVWANPTFINDFDKKSWYYYTLSQPRRLKSHETIGLLMRVGWLLGTPSMILLRADTVERDPQIWKSSNSVDLIIGAIAAARGDTVLLPAGAIAAVSHERQDGATQGVSLALSRAVESLQYLRRRPESDLRRLAAGFAGVSIIRWARNLISAFARGNGVGRSDVQNYMRLIGDMDSASWISAISEFRKILSAVRCAWFRRRPISIDAFFKTVKW